MLPRARTVKPGLLLHQVKRAGLDLAQFEELLDNAKDAIKLYLEVLAEDGAPIPRDEEVVFCVTVAA